jgi:hypothetical protein
MGQSSSARPAAGYQARTAQCPIHALRHYSATDLLAAGIDLRTLAGRLGHGSGGATTPETYAAWAEQADRRASQMIVVIVPSRSRNLWFPGEPTSPSRWLCTTSQRPPPDPGLAAHSRRTRCRMQP